MIRKATCIVKFMDKFKLSQNKLIHKQLFKHFYNELVSSKLSSFMNYSVNFKKFNSQNRLLSSPYAWPSSASARTAYAPLPCLVFPLIPNRDNIPHLLFQEEQSSQYQHFIEYFSSNWLQNLFINGICFGRG